MQGVDLEVVVRNYTSCPEPYTQTLTPTPQTLLHSQLSHKCLCFCLLDLLAHSPWHETVIATIGRSHGRWGAVQPPRFQQNSARGTGVGRP